MNTQYVVQSRASERYSRLFELAFAHARYTRIDVAVAYATLSGVRTLEKFFATSIGTTFNTMKKRWLVGIDWCRSDPSALSKLNSLPCSKVRVPNGRILVQRADCSPQQPFHPKLFMLSGEKAAAIICGSGNLSESGLSIGCECGSVSLITHVDQRLTDPQFAKLQDWFKDAWRNAASYESLLNQYEIRCDQQIRQKRTILTDDDILPSQQDPSKRGLSPFQIKQLRTYSHFWIEAGALGANLGAGVPGNQLDMTRYSRVFFGARAADVPPSTVIDYVTLVWDGTAYGSRTLKYGNNGMDKLNVPPAGERGAKFYKDKTLLFTRLPNGTFAFHVGAQRDPRQWQLESEKRQANYRLPGGRRWGLF
jgi:hypothetical protein